jgi:hypothetical protein
VAARDDLEVRDLALDADVLGRAFDEPAELPVKVADGEDRRLLSDRRLFTAGRLAPIGRAALREGQLRLGGAPIP